MNNYIFVRYVHPEHGLEVVKFAYHQETRRQARDRILSYLYNIESAHSIKLLTVEQFLTEVFEQDKILYKNVTIDEFQAAR